MCSSKRPLMRFLLDGMLGRLTRWLRIIGCEAWYSRDSSDDELLRRAEQESLVLLTADVQLFRTAIAKSIEAFLVEGQYETERLANVAVRFGLTLELDTTKSRCPVCGFAIRSVTKDQIANLVPPTTFKVYQSFWICTNASCAKVYWQGSHWKRIEETLVNSREILERKKFRDRGELSIPRRRTSARTTGTSSYKRVLEK